jgi:hypothetical protein
MHPTKPDRRAVTLLALLAAWVLFALATGARPRPGGGAIRPKSAAVEKGLEQANLNTARARSVGSLEGIAASRRLLREGRGRLSRECAVLGQGADVAAMEAGTAEAGARLCPLPEGLEQDDPAEARAVLQVEVSRVELWWEHQQAAIRTRARFVRGLIHIRGDVSGAFLSPLPEQSCWKGEGDAGGRARTWVASSGQR